MIERQCINLELGAFFTPKRAAVPFVRQCQISPHLYDVAEESIPAARASLLLSLSTAGSLHRSDQQQVLTWVDK